MSVLRHVCNRSMLLLSLSVGVSTQAEVVFQDNFEGRLAGQTPIASVGAYVSGGFTAPVVQTAGVGTNGAGTTHAASPTPGDTQLVVLDRTGSPSRNIRRLYGQFDEAAVTAGDTVRFSFDANVFAGELGFGLSDSLDTAALDFTAPIRASLLVYLVADGTVAARNEVAEPDVARQVIPGVGHALGNWQRYTLEYVLGATSMSLTVGDDTVPIAFLSTDGGTLSRLDGLYFSAGSNATTVYLDNLAVEVIPVPEPGSAAGLSLLSFAFVMRRRRRVGVSV